MLLGRYMKHAQVLPIPIEAPPIPLSQVSNDTGPESPQRTTCWITLNSGIYENKDPMMGKPCFPPKR